MRYEFQAINEGLLSSSSPLCRVFTLIFLQQSMSLGNRVLQLYSVVLDHGANNASYSVKSVVLVH